VRAGDFFYIPAGTVHAIGAGVSLIEVQQNADITYRLYDYGRPRELHLDDAIAVASGQPHDPGLRFPVPQQGTLELADGRYFTLHRVDGEPDAALRRRYAGPLLVVPLTGEVRIGAEALAPGTCGFARDIAEVVFASSGQALVARPK
jgi:mannose-6-phosphate isomerase